MSRSPKTDYASCKGPRTRGPARSRPGRSVLPVAKQAILAQALRACAGVGEPDAVPPQRASLPARCRHLPAPACSGGPERLVRWTRTRLVHFADLHNGNLVLVRPAGEFDHDSAGTRLPLSIFIALCLCLTEFSAGRRRGAQALRASEERFRALVQFSFDVYWESDPQHRFTRQDSPTASPTRRRPVLKSARRAGKFRTSNRTKKPGASTGPRSTRTCRSGISSSPARRPRAASGTCQFPEYPRSTKLGDFWATAASAGTSLRARAPRLSTGRTSGSSSR